MNDRELLELAANAAGFGVYFDDVDQCCKRQPRNPMATWLWNPLTDDGDAFRLMVRCCFHVCIFQAVEVDGVRSPGFVGVWKESDRDPLHVENVCDDYAAATRRAITMAATVIGKEIP